MVLFKYIHKCKCGIGAYMWYEPTDEGSLVLYLELTEESSAAFHLSMGLHFIVIGVVLLFMDLLSPCIVWIPAPAGPCCPISLHDAGSSSCQGCKQTEIWDAFCRLVQKSNLSHWHHCRSLWRWHDVGLVGWEGVCGWIKKSLTFTLGLYGIWSKLQLTKASN